MEDQEQLIEQLLEKGEQYGKTSLELYKLKTLEVSSDVASGLISWLVVGIFAILFFLILNIGLGLWIGHLLGNSWHGFFAISGFYAFFALLFGIFRKKMIKNPINNSIINSVLK
jgi:hypothetical protein